MRAVVQMAGVWATAAMAALPAVVNAQGNQQATNAATIVVSAEGRVPFLFTTNADNTVTITGYRSTTAKATAVTIPNRINNLPVTNIGKGAFGLSKHVDDPRLTSVAIPYGVTNIGEWAFNCCGLTNVTIPPNVTSIGNNAFDGCTSLTNLTVPASVTNIGDGVFSFCRSLTSVTIPDGVTSIGIGAFYLCTSLSNVTIPNSVTNIGNFAFTQCSNLTGVCFKGNAPSLHHQMSFGATNATIYYLEGTKGWGKEFGGRPTAIWKPQTNGVPFSGAQR